MTGRKSLSGADRTRMKNFRPCTLARNPWPDTTVTLYRNGNKTEDLSGSLLTFPTVKGEIVSVVPKGLKPPQKEVLQ